MEQNSRQKEFRERFARHADELKWLYMELYHGDESAYHYFVEMLSRMYAARSEARSEDWGKAAYSRLAGAQSLDDLTARYSEMTAELRRMAAGIKKRKGWT